MNAHFSPHVISGDGMVQRQFPIFSKPAFRLFLTCASLVWLLVLSAIPALGWTLAASAEEKTQRDRWVAANLAPAAPAKPFSFVYGGRLAEPCLKTWSVKRAIGNWDDSKRRSLTTTYTDPDSGLQVRCVSVEYQDFPTIEWTLYLKNTGKSPTPILESLRALSITVEIEPGKSATYLLNHLNNRGTRRDPLEPGTVRRFTADDGRPTLDDMPYFNLETPSGGMIVAIGWPTQWAAEFARGEGNSVRITAGQEFTHFSLLPGEEVRTPLVILQFYRGDWIRAQNLWRRWVTAHNMPRPNGNLPPPQRAGSSAPYFFEMTHANEANQKLFIDRHIEEGLKPDYWWMDAGWYECSAGAYLPGNHWAKTGTWVTDRKRFPNGLRAITDYLHSKGMKSIVWFEPERVMPGTALDRQHPEWLIESPPINYTGGNPFWIEEAKIEVLKRLFDMGNPTARQWITDALSRIIDEEGIDTYRQDHNFGWELGATLRFWKKMDPPNRQGIAENHYAVGLLAFYDGLRQKHPGLLMDHHVVEPETLRRFIDLLLDLSNNPTDNQWHNYGVPLWIPYHGLGTGALDTYSFRSAMGPAIVTFWDVRKKDLDYPLLRRLVKEWEACAPFYLCDYYPLTPPSRDGNVWMAWQYDRPESGEGILQAFRRQEAQADSLVLKLRGLQPDGIYSLKDFDTGLSTQRRGSELMETGLTVKLAAKPASALINYRITQ